jgi:alkylation response protein AidB-like acyl-CoA dehydrogenase
MLETLRHDPDLPFVMPTDEERSLLRDSQRGWLAEHWPVERATGNASDSAALSAVWKGLSAQGITSLGSIPAEGGLREMVVALQELGRAACPVPLIDACVLHLLFTGSRQNVEVQRLLAGVADGQILPCLSFGALDAEPAAGAVTLTGDRVTGTLDFVESATVATHLLVAAPTGDALLCIDTRSSGVAVSSRPALGVEGLARVALEGAPATVLPVALGLLREALAVSRLLHAARAWGAADRAFELVVDYVKQRRQFGQPVGRFQALQHKLANNLVALTGARLSIVNAADHFDRGVAHWQTFAAAAWAYAATALRQVSLETQHAFGAIGYAEEHEVPRHFRRVHLDVSRHGGARVGRDELAGRYLGAQPEKFPEFDLGEAGNALRRDVRAWLAEHWPESRRHAHEQRDATHRDFDAAFAREIGKTGWLGLTWPKKFGGMEASAYELLAFLEETERVGAPRAGSPIQAAAWMIYGTPEQQARYLPELLNGDVMYGMWYSEPDSGSDLASLRTTAVKDGDEWVINGQKIWTTTYWGDYMWLAARTDTQAKPAHAGISMFVVHKSTPGITLRPMRTMYDGEFCNTFLDNVRVPADALVGELHGGWQVLTGSLGIERAYVGSRIMLQVAGHFERLCDLIRSTEQRGKPLRLDPVVRDLIGGFAAQIEVGRQLALNSIHLYAQGKEPTWEAAMAKVFAGELMERLGEAALDVFGMRALLSRPNSDAPLAGKLEQKLRHSLMWVISLGTNEIQRSLIAQRGLDLPR